MTKDKEKKIKCEFCNKPIHINQLGLVFGDKGKQIWVCDNITCLVQAKEKYKLV